MKVALLSDCYLPRLGGIEVQVHDLARNLLAAGHEVEAFTATPGAGERYKGTEVLDGVTVHRLALNLPRHVAINPFAVRELHRRLAEGGFDVAHVAMGVISPFSMDSVRVGHRLGIPTVVTWHSLVEPLTPLIDAAGFVGRWALAGSTLTAVSAVAARPLQGIVPDGHTIEVLPNGIDATRWTPGDHTDHDEFRVVTAMRLTTRKRPIHLLRIVRRARQLCPGRRLRLEIYGEGPWRDRMEAWIQMNDAGSWVSLPGRVTRDELYRRYLEADCYIAPAELESFGIAALEARTTGVPVVGPARSGISEFVHHEVNGLLSRDDEDMAACVARLAREPELRARMRRHNVEHEPEQTWPRVTAATVATYERAIAEQRPGGRA